MSSILHTAILEFSRSAVGREHGIECNERFESIAMSGRSSNYGLLTVAVFPSQARAAPFILRIARRKDARHLHREKAVLGEVRPLLGADLTSTIPEPLYLGEARGHPFLVSTFLPGEVLVSALRGPLRLWKGVVLRYCTSWLLALGRQTARRLSDKRLACALETLEHAAGSKSLDYLIRQKAARAALFLQSCSPDIPCVVQHGDFHAENILTNPWGTLTGIVDWIDANSEGFPGVDLLQLAGSVGLDDQTRDRLLNTYADGLGVSPKLCCTLSTAHWLQVRRRVHAVFSHYELVQSIKIIERALLTLPS